MKYVPNTIKHIHKVDPKNILSEIQLNSHLSQKEQYVLGVFQTAMNLESTFEYLLCVPVFLRRFPEKQRLKKYFINQPMYIHYHIHVHYIRIASILDQMSILVNRVYRLGIPDKKCSADIVSENEHTCNSNAVSIIKKFNKSIQSFKSTRNSIVHRGIYQDEGLIKVEMYHYTKENYPNVVSDHLLNYKTRSFLKQKIVNIDKDNLAVAKYLKMFFDELSIPFDKQYINLQ